MKVVVVHRPGAVLLVRGRCPERRARIWLGALRLHEAFRARLPRFMLRLWSAVLWSRWIGDACGCVVTLKVSDDVEGHREQETARIDRYLYAIESLPERASTEEARLAWMHARLPASRPASPHHRRL